MPFRNVSLRVAEVDAERLLAGGEAIAALLFSPSDSAKSCLMISPFSHFSAFLGPPAHVFAKIANTAGAVHNSDEYDANHYAVFHNMCGSKQSFKAGILGILHLLELRDVGYRSCCPDPPLLCVLVRRLTPQVGRYSLLSSTANKRTWLSSCISFEVEINKSKTGLKLIYLIFSARTG